MVAEDSINPKKEVERYLLDNPNDNRDSTVTNHRYRLGRFLDWCEETGFDDMTQLTGRTANNYRRSRSEDGIQLITLTNQMKTFRVFVKYCEDNDSVPVGVSDKITIPKVEVEDEKADNRDMDPERADEILDWLNTFRYASDEHVIFALLVEMGCRMSAVRGLDLDSIQEADDGQPYAELLHRPESDTPLKRGQSGERNVLLGVNVESISEVVADYIENNRHDVQDDGYGRTPLITTKQGRIAPSTFRQKMYKVTHPASMGEECDHADEECPYTSYADRSKCPETFSPHACRHAYVTRMRDYDDLPDEVLGDRIDMSPKTMEKYYDERDKNTRMNQRGRIFEDAMSDD